jgi:NAD(P)-dependent dehydrogenase (short-subunit alcohol dehydrogenase family)
VLGMKYAVPSMIERGGGSIVNTASVAGLQAGYGPFAYSVAKGAVVHLSRVAAAALARHGIRVNAICPGFIPTAIFGRALGESIADADRRAHDMSERAHGFQPIRIAGSPEDVGNAVAFFASDLSRFVTGQYLAVDGGLTVGPRQAWEESAAIESWRNMGLSEEQVKKLLGTA